MEAQRLLKGGASAQVLLRHALKTNDMTLVRAALTALEGEGPALEGIELNKVTSALAAAELEEDRAIYNDAFAEFISAFSIDVGEEVTSELVETCWGLWYEPFEKGENEGMDMVEFVPSDPLLMTEHRFWDTLESDKLFVSQYGIAGFHERMAKVCIIQGLEDYIAAQKEDG